MAERRPKQKWFSYKQIRGKIEGRSEIAEYEDLLMGSKVMERDGGMVFDTNHLCWANLVRRCKEVDAAAKAEKSASPTPKPTAAANDRSASTTGSDWVDVSLEQLEQDLERTCADDQIKEVRASLLQELQEPVPDPFLVRQQCKLCGVPREVRGEVWRVLLGCWGKGEELSAATDLDLRNQRVIRADIERTLPTLERFQDTTVRANMELILTTYCKEQDISYKQGMNYVMVPFFLCMDDRDHVYNCYIATIAGLVSNTFTDEEFGGLQCIFTLFKFLLLYHDPELGQFLDKHDMGPELYASSWFITLHANRCTTEVLLRLWDHLLLELPHDPHLHYFVSLALLISYRDEILAENEVTLPETLSKLKIRTVAECDMLVMRAKNTYRSQTSQSNRDHMLDITSRKISPDSQEYDVLMGLPCLEVSAEEIISHCYAHTGTGSSTAAQVPAQLKFIVLDCRPKQQWDSGHFPRAFHLDPRLVNAPAELALEVQKWDVYQAEQCHFVFFANEDDEDNKRQRAFFNVYFLQKSFKYISNCRGGYEAVHELVLAADKELVDHKASRCRQCRRKQGKLTKTRSPPPATRPGAGRSAFLSSFRSRFSGLSGILQDPPPEAESDEDREDESQDVAYKRLNLPPTCLVLPPSHHRRILHSVLRNKHSTGVPFASTVNQLTTMVLGQALESAEMEDVAIVTANGGHFSGRRCRKRLCCVSCCPAAKHALDAAVVPLSAVVHVNTGKLLFEEDVKRRLQRISAAAPSFPRSGQERSEQGRSEQEEEDAGKLTASLPADIASRHVVVFEPVVAPDTRDMFLVVNELKNRGVNESSITIIALVAARRSVWSLSVQFPELTIVASAIDKWKAGRLVPGLSGVDERYSGAAAPSM